MKILVLFLISLPVYSNVFSLKETGARFDLEITKTHVTFHSEATDFKTNIRKCNEVLAKTLNGELISKIPNLPAESGMILKVDEKEIQFDPATDLGRMVFAMDARILRFKAEEKEACK